MVRALHAAGIEVILDVVYNHTAEGDQLGPTLSLRGIDNPAYYRLASGDQRRYVDFTGCGNTLNARHPEVLHLILDSLRYWVTDMHVDGFRFDLASALARGMHEADRLSSFFDLIHQDPVVSAVKLIAEPWDLGEGGYQVGNFPVLWTEWNGKYRDAVRDFWRGKGTSLAEMGYRLTGSSDLYQGSARKPSASINFVTAHDGFTLRDLVSYDRKHNEANGEHNRDGTDDNRSWNCGVEGDTDDADVLALRRRQQRNFLATLLLSQGVPMLVAGDEMRPHPAGQQQRLLPGQRAVVGRLGPGRGRLRPAGLHPAPDPAAAGPSRVPAAAVLPGPSHPRPAARRGGPGRHRLVRSRRPGDDRAGVGGEHGAGAGDVPQRRRDLGARAAGPAHRRRQLPGPPQRAQPGGASGCRARGGRRLSSSSSTPPTIGRASCSPRGTRSACWPTRWWCCARSRA